MTTTATDRTLTDLFTLTADRAEWPAFRRANTNTALKLLAKGLGKHDPSQCTVCDYTQSGELLMAALNRALVSKGPAVVRNMRNYLRTFLKTTVKLGLITPTVPDAPTTRMTARMTAKAAERAMHQGSTRGRVSAYRKKLAHWPDPLQAWWTEWNATRASKLRPVTRECCQYAVECYVGFLQDTAHSSGDLYLPANFRKFIKWHGTRCCDSEVFTTTAKWVLHALSVGAPSKDAVADLRAVRKEFNPAPRFHDKAREVEDLSLREVESVGLTLLEEARLPVTTKSKKTGEPSARTRLHRASAFRDALILRLLVRVPFRQRCIREMQFEKNLAKDREGRWIIRFRGNQLKIAWREGEENIWKVAFPADLCPLLEEYMRDIRPVLTNGRQTAHVFPNSLGAPLTEKKLRLKLSRRVYQYLEKRFYPHLIRTMWPTELSNTGEDIRAVAYMMNDKIETILRKYYSHNGEGLQEKAEQRLRLILGERGNAAAA